MLNEIGIGETQTSKDASVTVKDVRLRYTEELSYGKAVAWRGDWRLSLQTAVHTEVSFIPNYL